MANKELIKYGSFLTALAASALENSPAPTPFEGIDWQVMFSLAQRHNLVLLIYPQVKKLNPSPETVKLFTNEKNFMLARIMRQEIECEQIFKLLEANDIKYIKMKGSHIKELYPAYTRTHTDIDLCMSEQDRKKAKPLMLSLGYTLDSELDYHDEYQKDEFYIFELHSRMLADEENHSEFFENPFEKSICADERGFCYKLKDEYLYLHIFLHLYKHFSESGCGIRNFIDLYLLKKNLSKPQLEFAENIIKQSSMQAFYHNCLKLISYFFEGDTPDESTVQIAEYVFSETPSGVYENSKANLGFWGKVRYFLKMWFPSAKDLSFRYPVLEKAPVLLPVCWLRRIFYSLFFNRSAFKKQAENIKEINGKKYKKIRKARHTATKNN